MGEVPKVEMMDAGLNACIAFVGGNIECVQLDGNYTNGCDLWCNEEGLFTCEPNRHVTLDWGYSQVVNGPMFIAAHDPEGDTVGLSDAECDKWLALSNEWPRTLSSLPDDATPGHGVLFLIM